MIEPITPSEAIAEKETHFPDFVIAAFNKLIIINLSNGLARFSEKDIVDEIIYSQNDTVTNTIIVDNKWLNVESVYKSKGWEVLHHKNHSFGPFFTFKIK